MRHGIAVVLVAFLAFAFPAYAKEPPLPPVPDALQELMGKEAKHFDTSLENLYGVWTAKLYWQTAEEKILYMVRVIVSYDGRDYVFPNEINEWTILEIWWNAYPPDGGEPRTLQWINTPLIRELGEKMKQRRPGGGNI